jgi:chemotaxis protein histidine kinase CheA
MVDSLEDKLLAGAAYRIFVEEVAKHLSALDNFFHQSSWTEEHLRAASARYHTLRGGAGFFKLTEVSRIAGELEVALREASVEDFMSDLQRFAELDGALRKVAQGIPQPKS